MCCPATRKPAIGSRHSAVETMVQTRAEIRSYRDLRVWNEAMTLAETACRLTIQFPKHEVYGFTAQVRRSAASIPANIGLIRSLDADG